jgi:hypothetical protein
MSNIQTLLWLIILVHIFKKINNNNNKNKNNHRPEIPLNITKPHKRLEKEGQKRMRGGGIRSHR